MIRIPIKKTLDSPVQVLRNFKEPETLTFKGTLKEILQVLWTLHPLINPVNEGYEITLNCS